MLNSSLLALLAFSSGMALTAEVTGNITSISMNEKGAAFPLIYSTTNVAIDGKVEKKKCVLCPCDINKRICYCIRDGCCKKCTPPPPCKGKNCWSLPAPSLGDSTDVDAVEVGKKVDKKAMDGVVNEATDDTEYPMLYSTTTVTVNGKSQEKSCVICPCDQYDRCYCIRNACCKNCIKQPKAGLVMDAKAVSAAEGIEDGTYQVSNEEIATEIVKAAAIDSAAFPFRYSTHTTTTNGNIEQETCRLCPCLFGRCFCVKRGCCEKLCRNSPQANLLDARTAIDAEQEKEVGNVVVDEVVNGATINDVIPILSSVTDIMVNGKVEKEKCKICPCVFGRCYCVKNGCCSRKCVKPPQVGLIDSVTVNTAEGKSEIASEGTEYITLQVTNEAANNDAFPLLSAVRNIIVDGKVEKRKCRFCQCFGFCFCINNGCCENLCVKQPQTGALLNVRTLGIEAGNEVIEDSTDDVLNDSTDELVKVLEPSTAIAAPEPPRTAMTDLEFDPSDSKASEMVQVQIKKAFPLGRVSREVMVNGQVQKVGCIACLKDCGNVYCVKNGCCGTKSTPVVEIRRVTNIVAEATAH
ncbi:hypothetical protein GQ43DRAFT_483594 [Delitschia confertaspora ATCC 74209]|uniref:CRC domain-containing protein n=1 Tax=Delitschia confertaspora ATCC 74209 TaxID=1513339 RepID=A0A9P4MPM7_9PLEO|nr:hypothetical protein GQ43DRAFT_483594 [Delitschia confertaspora ATCC 74209]